MAYVPNSGSVVAFQSNPSVMQTLTGLMSTNASVITVGGAGVANQSVSGTVGASIIGLAPVSVSNFPAVQAVAPNNSSIFALQQAGSVLAVSGSFSPSGNQSVSGTVQTDVRGSVATVIIGGSIAASFTPPANQSVSGTVEIGNFPLTQNVAGSVVSFQGTSPWIITGSVQGNFGGGNSSVQVLNFPANQSVSGTVGASVIGTVPVTQSGTWSTSVMTNVITSIATAGQVMGSVAALQATNPWNIAGSVVAFQAGTNTTSVSGQVTVVSSIAGGIFPISGSVAAVVTNTVNVNTAGSVIAFQGGTVITSISGVPQASVHGAVSIVPASVITGNGSLVGAASVQLFSAASGVRNYVTAFLVSNTGAATTLVTFTDGDASVIGKTIAPAGGGSNAPALATPFIPSVNKVVNVVAATATSVLHVWVGGYRAP